MKIKYLKNVTSPPSQVGKAGETKDVSKRIATLLIKGGFAERAKDVKQRTDTKGK